MELGVATILEGGVQRAGDRIRINAQLIDATTDVHLWAETYDRQLTAENIFSIQSEISNTIASSLRATLSTEDQTRLANVPTENLAAYEAYMLGIQRLKSRTETALLEATRFFQRAANLDPNFALSHAGLATSFLLQPSYGMTRREIVYPKAIEAAEKAISLDENIGEAYAVLATVFHESRFPIVAEIERDMTTPQNIETLFLRAIKLNPNYAAAYQWFGEFLDYEGRSAESLVQLRKAVEIDPLSPIINFILGGQLRSSGYVDEALARYQKAIEIDPNFPRAHSGLALLFLVDRGEVGDALAYAEKAKLLDPRVSSYSAIIAIINLTLTDDIAAERELAEASRLGPDRGNVVSVTLALHAYRGEHERAMDYAREYIDSYPPSAILLRIYKDNAVRAGTMDEALAVFQNGVADLFEADLATVNASNYRQAIDLASLLQKTGNREQANLLLEKSLEFLSQMSPRRPSGYNLQEVEIYALQGKVTKALSTLRNEIDAGWRTWWFYHFPRNTNLDSIRDEPEFQAMAAEVRADMAAQLADVQARKKPNR